MKDNFSLQDQLILSRLLIALILTFITNQTCIIRFKNLCYYFPDLILNDAAKIVRLLHIKELRDLQTQINAAIVGVQALTANPKTDSRLGKVGRM